MDVSVKRLGSADLETMRGLIEMFGEAFGELEIYQANPPSDSYLERVLADP